MVQAMGYGAVFPSRDAGSEYWLDDSLVEIIHPRAFDDTVREHDIIASMNHNLDLLLGRTSAGTMRLSIDDKGLRYAIDLPDTSVGRDAAESLRRRDLNGSSISFVPLKQSFHEEKRGSKTVIVRTILKARLYELGPVALPAYTGTTAHMTT